MGGKKISGYELSGILAVKSEFSKEEIEKYSDDIMELFEDLDMVHLSWKPIVEGVKESSWIIYRNGEFEDEKALVDDLTGEVHVIGDQYHDHIDDQISSYLEAMKRFGIYDGEVVSKTVYKEDSEFSRVFIGDYE